MDALRTVFQGTIVSKQSYASQAWWGFASVSNINRIDAVLKRSFKFGYTSTLLNAQTLFGGYDCNLFKNITTNHSHTLQPLLPPLKNVCYNLRLRIHNYTLPQKDNRNFISRMLFRSQDIRTALKSVSIILVVSEFDA